MNSLWGNSCGVKSDDRQLLIKSFVIERQQVESASSLLPILTIKFWLNGWRDVSGGVSVLSVGTREKRRKTGEEEITTECEGETEGRRGEAINTSPHMTAVCRSPTSPHCAVQCVCHSSRYFTSLSSESYSFLTF